MSDHNRTNSAARDRPRRRERHRMRDRGISDVVAFVLIFSMVIVSGSIVATAGVDQLTELRDFEQVQSSERAMEVAAADLSRLQRGSPVTDLVFATNGGSLWLNESSLQVNASGPGVDSEEINGSYQVNSLEHRLSRGTQDVTVAYESGGVMRSDGATFEFEPRWQRDTETVIVTIVSLREGSDEITAVSGGFSPDFAINPRRGVPQDAAARDPDQTIQIDAEANFTARQQWHVPFNGSETGTVQIDVSETANPDQWARSLEEAGWDETAPYEYEADAEETILIRHVVIELS